MTDTITYLGCKWKSKGSYAVSP